MTEITYFAKQGWQCPICKGIMSPNYPTCFNCKPNKAIAIYTICGSCKKELIEDKHHERN